VPEKRNIQQVLVGGISIVYEMASKIVDKIDPFQNKALIKSRKQKRSQGSSHYRSPGTSELQALPQLKGIDFQLVLNEYRQSHHNILTILLK